jgi:hypothetical protein
MPTAYCWVFPRGCSWRTSSPCCANHFPSRRTLARCCARRRCLVWSAGLLLFRCSALVPIAAHFSSSRIKGNKSFEAQGICRPAVCLCYWSPLPHVKLAVFVLARRKSVYSQTPRVAHITSLDESVQSFRLGLRALFAGEVPHRLVIAGADGAKIAMQDFAPLSQYQLLCFQVVTALFSQTMAEAAPAVPAERVAVLASGHHAPSPSPQGNIASESSGPACAAPAADLQPLLKCAGKNVTTFSKLLRGRHGAPIGTLTPAQVARRRFLSRTSAILR